MSTTPARDDVSTISSASRGERLLPYLFAATETCWIDGIIVGIASLNFRSSTFLVPLWSPFVFIVGVYWLLMSRQRQGSETSFGSVLVFAALLPALLLTLWSSIYANSFAFFDPGWLASFINDLLLLDGNAFHSILIVLILTYFGWRGSQLTRNPLEPSSVSRTLKVGLGIFLAVIVVRALSGSQQTHEFALLLLIPLFLAFVLMTHSLARIALLRHSHPDGLQGSTTAQENSLLSIIATIGVILLLLALLIGTVASPAFLAQVQHFLAPVGVAYDWLTRAIAYIATLLLLPIFWLFQVLNLHLTQPNRKLLQPPPGTSKLVSPKSPVSDPIIHALGHVVEFVLPILAIILIIVAARLVLRYRRVRRMRRQEDQHESLWSWNLFWTQVRAFLTHLFLRLLPKRQRQEQLPVIEGISGEPSVHSMREIYRALLHWAASQGIARKRAETPYEFRARLHEGLPLVEPELSIVTEAYIATRYGNATLDENDVARVRETWLRLQQKQQTQIHRK